MNRIKTLTLLLMVILSGGISAQNPRSVFTDRPAAEAAVYITTGAWMFPMPCKRR